MKSTQAFTLMETLVVLAIVGIILAMSLPVLRHFYQRTDADMMRLTLLRAIDFAEQEARARHTSVVLRKSSHNGWLLFVDSDEDGVLHDKAAIIEIIQNRQRAGNIYFRSFPFYRDFLLFPAAGLTAYDNATFWYCNMGDDAPVWAVSMSKTGETHTRYPEADGTMKDSSGNVLACT